MRPCCDCLLASGVRFESCCARLLLLLWLSPCIISDWIVCNARFGLVLCEVCAPPEAAILVYGKPLFSVLADSRFIM